MHNAVSAGVRSQLLARRSHTPLPGAAILAWSMFVVVLVGFAPTFLLREALGKPPLPAHLALHGTILTCWYAVVAAQTTLLIGDRYSWHRKLGWGAALLGATVIGSSVYSVLALAHRFAQGVPHSAKEAAEFNFQVAASGGAILPFLLCLSLALSFRKQRALHGRLMLLASVSLIGPAISRVATWFGELPNPASALILLSPLALCLRDFVSERRVHAVTILGTVGVLGITFGLNAVNLGDVLVRLYR
jgi:hypothetical protein